MSIHGINTLMSDLNSVKEDQLPSQTHHKEEAKGRIKSDATDRKAIRSKLDLTIDPFDLEQHPKIGLVNVVTGKVV